MRAKPFPTGVVLLIIFTTSSHSFRPNRPKPRPQVRFQVSGKTLGASASIANWCYGNSTECGEPSWGNLCHNGSRQSPIDLPSLKGQKASETIKNFPAGTHRLQGFTLFNNGDNLEIYPEEEDEDTTPIFEWPQHQGTYQFHSVDFHWGSTDDKGSEHSINGQHFAMEIQFIYYRSDTGSFEEALYRRRTPNALAAIGVLIEADPDALPLKVFDIILKHIDKVKNPVRLDIDADIDFEELLTFQKAYSYMGSACNPPCSENVLWLVRVDPVKVNPSQLEKFRGLITRFGKNMENNFRNTKKKKAHDIIIYKLQQEDKRK